MIFKLRALLAIGEYLQFVIINSVCTRLDLVYGMRFYIKGADSLGLFKNYIGCALLILTLSVRKGSNSIVSVSLACDSIILNDPFCGGDNCFRMPVTAIVTYSPGLYVWVIIFLFSLLLLLLILSYLRFRIAFQPESIFTGINISWPSTRCAGEYPRVLWIALLMVYAALVVNSSKGSFSLSSSISRLNVYKQSLRTWCACSRFTLYFRFQDPLGLFLSPILLHRSTNFDLNSIPPLNPISFGHRYWASYTLSSSHWDTTMDGRKSR